MRTSSMKSLTAVTTLVITLSLAVPQVEAKPVQPRDGARGVIASVSQFFKRIASNWKPGDPIPVAVTEPLMADSPETAKSTLRP